jgi:hypothetical protein
MNAVYGRFFPQPYPNRATIVAQLMVPGARIEIVAYAHVGARVAARPKAKAAAKRRGARPKSRAKRRAASRAGRRR